MTELPLTDEDRKAHISIRMSTWDGDRSEPRYFGSWAAAVRFLRSDDFTLVPGVRTVTVKQLNDSGSRWKPSPEEKAELEDRAQRELACRACGAAAGSPCSGPEPGHPVHGPRYVDALKAAREEITRQLRKAEGLPHGLHG